MIRFTIVIDEATFAGLCRLADTRRLDPRAQAVSLILEGLERAGVQTNKNLSAGGAEVCNPLLAGNGVDSIISASTRTSMDGAGDARE